MLKQIIKNYKKSRIKYKYITKKELKEVRKKRTKTKECTDKLKLKQEYINKDNDFKSKKIKKWIIKHNKGFKFRLGVRMLRIRLARLKLPLYLSFIRWVIVDFLRGKITSFNGIYEFVALPGQGKTLSMVRHIEKKRKKYKNLYIATNFNYKYQNMAINHWTDIIKASKLCVKENRECIVAIDEIHVTFDATNYRDFPPEMLALLSFNRKFKLQFICSAQIYERIPKKISDIANYVVICKNIFNLDRLFVMYYFEKANYEDKFSGKRKKCKFLDQYVADDYLYGLYNTLEQVDKMTEETAKEKSKKAEAIELLFGKDESSEAVK